MSCPLCDKREPWVSLQTTFADLCTTADLGCPFCTVIKEGIVQFAKKDVVTNISLTHLIETRRESQLGQQRPLRVEFNTEFGGNTNLEFYTDDGQSTHICLSRSLLVSAETSCRKRLTYV
jgi:hypothetical protein